MNEYEYEFPKNWCINLDFVIVTKRPLSKRNLCYSICNCNIKLMQIQINYYQKTNIYKMLQ